MRRLALVVAVGLAATASAQEPRLLLRFPAMDLPFNAEQGGSFPSMRQSLLLNADVAQASHHLIFRGLERIHPFWGRLGAVLTIAALDTFVLQWAEIWMHEEWHRAVMSRRGVASFDDAYRLQVVGGGVSVSHLADEDLVRLKRDYPGDMIRLHEAGMESELELVRHLQKGALFQGVSAVPDLFTAWLATLGVLAYRQTCATTVGDEATDYWNATEGTNVPVRDFTGLDCTAWAYDLSRPGEPYEARGVHPSGVGIDRYIRYSDLTADEQRLMRRARNLGLLNLVSPLLVGIGGFEGTSPLDHRPFRWTASLRHHLTTYGHELSLDGLLKRDDWNLALSYHHGMNALGVFPGLEAELVRLPVVVGGTAMKVNATAMLWLQPERQQYATDQAQLGGLLRAGMDLPIAGWADLWIEAELKTAGWVAGVEALEPGFAFRAGVVVAL